MSQIIAKEVTPKTIRVRKDELRTNFRKVIRNVS